MMLFLKKYVYNVLSCMFMAAFKNVAQSQEKLALDLHPLLSYK